MADQPPPLDPRLVAAVAAYQAQTAAMRAALAGYVQRLWRSLGSWRAGDIGPFVSQAVPVVVGAQTRMAGLTAAFLALQQQVALGGIGKPAAVNTRHVTGAATRNGTALAEVYGRPFHLVWRQLSELAREPGAVDRAIQAGSDRAVQLAVTDLQRSKQLTNAQVIGEDRHATGYRRVLEGPSSCALCIVASTLLYHNKQLLPVHPGCDCSQETVYDETGPTISAMVRVGDRLVNVGELPDLHQRVEDRFGVSSSAARAIPRRGLPDYKDVLVIHEHGELGPVLGVRGEPFLGPDDLAA